MSEKKRILKEFEWFEVQTKVREIISDVLLPLEKKLQSNSNAISRLQQNNREQQHKIQQLSLLVNNDQDIFKNGIFSSVQSKFDEQAILIKAIESKIGYLQSHVSEKVAVLDRRLEESTEVLGAINQFKEYVKTELEDQSKKIVESKANLMQNFEEINKEISQLSIKLQRLSSQHQIQTKRTTIIEHNISKSSQQVAQQLQSFYTLLKQIKIQEQVNSSRIIQNKQDITRLSVYQKMMSKLQGLVNEQQIRIDNLQYKIEVIQPLVSFSQINQYAHHILPNKFHRNISVYYYNRYNELIEQILNTEFNERRMKQSVKGNLNLVKQAHKRSIKVVFKLKKEFLERKGVNIDNLSHEKKEEQLASIKLSEDFKGIEDNQHEQPKQVVAPVSDAKVAKELVQALGRELIDRIQAQMKDSKSYIHSMQELLKRQIQQIDNSLKKTTEAVQDLQINFQLEQKANKDYTSSADLFDKNLKQEVKSIKLVLKQLCEMITIYNQIERQDEKDRQSIILLGVKERHRDEINQSRKHPNATVDLSKQCLSCSGNPNYFNQFFKMACLTYTSSPLSIDNKPIERIQVLNKLSQQLQQLKGIFSNHEIQAIPVQSHKKYKKEEPSLYNQFASSQIMSLPQRQQVSVSDRLSARNTSSSQQMRPNLRSPQQPRIINPSQLTQEVLARTRTRLFSRKLQRSFRESRSKQQKNSKDRSEFMGNVGRYFHQLSSQHDLSGRK